MHRPGGFPITFHLDGTVTTANLSGVVRWELVGDTLVLLGTHRPLYRFEWSGDYESFHSCPATSGPPMVIYPSQAAGLMGKLDYCANQMQRSNLNAASRWLPGRAGWGTRWSFAM